MNFYRQTWIATASLFFCFAGIAAEKSEPLHLTARSRARSATDSNDWQLVEKTVAWDPKKTALVICDMWDKHWCEGATRRVAEMAPRMNEVVKRTRAQGVFIIHCPSDTMKFYEGTPGRRLAQSAPPATAKVPLQRWCSLDRAKEAPLPLDDSDGGCDDSPQCKTYTAWKQEIPGIDIKQGDAITDSAEAYYLMQQRGIDNVIVMGVHLNMCVLGRPFSIRQMVNQGKNVLLMRDMTDTMYNSRKSPFVPHCAGTELMIQHVEKFWCPTINSVAFLGGSEFQFSEDKRPHIVFLIGEDEYKTWETLPVFAKKDLSWRGLRVSIIQEDRMDKNNFPHLVEALGDADLLLVSVRRRGLPKEQLDAVRAHLAAGKPLVGLRTACHAFAPRGNETGTAAWWPSFDPDVLGGNYTGHHGDGPKTATSAAPGEAANPILAGVDISRLVGNGSLYKVSPLKAETRPLLIGSIPGESAEPIAWTHSYGEKKARVFYTSLGHPDDFSNPAFRRLLLNGILWAIGQPIPPVTAAVVATDGKRFAADWRFPTEPGLANNITHIEVRETKIEEASFAALASSAE
jgi:nicotinamidase-related amidase/type 1 glutamine amidotransferase